jgi:uncharacterized protein with ATP-grasp and redox domains
MQLAARAAGADENLVQQVGIMARRELACIWDAELSPPEISAPLYHATGKLCDNDDPYLEKKVRHTREALKYLPVIESMVREASDPFDTAVRISIAGNVIDFGTGYDREDPIMDGIMDGFLERSVRIDDTKALRQVASGAGTVLFIGDNAGETVFDRPFLSILGQTAELFYAVRERPVINDATVKDALLAGIGLHAELVSSGSCIPGTVFRDCSREFNDLYNRADLVIAKGQGNFETLTEFPRDGRLFMLFIIKCPVAARQVGGEVGDMVVMQW